VFGKQQSVHLHSLNIRQNAPTKATLTSWPAISSPTPNGRRPYLCVWICDSCHTG